MKVTERCNIACTYCYYFFGGDDSPLKRKPVFTTQKASDLVTFIERSLKYGLKSVRVILHGGEPLLLKKHAFDNLLESITLPLKDKVKIEFTLQTNATIIDDDWVELFVKHQIFVGVSIDGPADYNDLYRIDFSGKGTHSKVVRGINKLFDAYERGLMPKPGMIAVINPKFSAKRIYLHLTQELGFDSLHFLLPDHTYDTINPSELDLYTSYLIELVDCWAADTNRNRKIRFIDEAINRILSTPFQRDVIGKYINSKKLIITVDSDGAIGPEDTLRSVIPAAFETGVNISNSDSLDVVTNKIISSVLKEAIDIPESCVGCDWVSICRGGNLKNRFSSLDPVPFKRKSVFCEPLKELYITLTAYLNGSGVTEERLLYNINENTL
ncbi:radical SAM protein [Pseudoalteromonas fenneropenaei]|uniref:Radical SAM protein n=1 Tax=Pseudoalteromonas fenneropenaei TaxID=1737459 RepID=A0ABV7CJA0_9GAMM